MNKEQYPEVRELLEELLERDFKIVGGNSGGDDVDFYTVGEAVELVHSVDESYIYVEYDNRCYWLFFVLGNEQGVALNDYGVNDDIEEVSEMIYNKYNQNSHYESN